MLSFSNQYPSHVWLAIMWYTPGCSDGGDWTKKGWWSIDPGSSVNVLDLDLDETNRYYCFYAEADDGAVWTGPYVRNLPYEAFEWCEWTGSTDSRDLGLRAFDISDNDDYTVNLTP